MVAFGLMIGSQERRMNIKIATHYNMNLSMSRDVYCEFKNIAFAQRRLMSHIAEDLFREYIAQYKREHGDIPEPVGTQVWTRVQSQQQ
jgi:hypothetical protein